MRFVFLVRVRAGGEGCGARTELQHQDHRPPHGYHERARRDEVRCLPATHQGPVYEPRLGLVLLSMACHLIVPPTPGGKRARARETRWNG